MTPQQGKNTESAAHGLMLPVNNHSDGWYHILNLLILDTVMFRKQQGYLAAEESGDPSIFNPTEKLN